MDNWLKGLIAAACCVVIGAAGYFAWGEWRKSQERADYEASLRYARIELHRLAEAGPDDIKKVTQFCEMAQKYDVMTTKQANRQVVSTCLTLGYL